MFTNVLHRKRPTGERATEAQPDAQPRIPTGQVTNDPTVDLGAPGAPAVTRPADTAMPALGRIMTRRRSAATTEPETRPTTTVEERPPWAHTSLAAMLGLTIGVLAAAATATGLLAPLGVAIGGVGAVLSVIGLARAGRHGMTGHSAALAGLIASLAALIVGVLAIQGRLSWLDSDTDEVARLHTWLNSTFPWLKRW